MAGPSAPGVGTRVTIGSKKTPTGCLIATATTATFCYGPTAEIPKGIPKGGMKAIAASDSVEHPMRGVDSGKAKYKNALYIQSWGKMEK